MRKTYATDLSDEEWDCLFYVLRSSCPWRMLPGDFPPWPTVYYHFRRFRLSGLWHRAFAILRAAERKRVGKNPLRLRSH